MQLKSDFCPFKHENVESVTAVVSVTKAKKDTKNLFLIETLITNL